MSLGAEAAGIRVALAVEAEPHAARTYNLNHPKTPIFVGDIRTLTALDLRTIDRSAQTIVFGGSPCQGFSTSNQRTRNAQNPSNWLYLEFVRIVKILKPYFLVFENVTGFKETVGGAFFSGLLERLSKLGYDLTFSVLNALDFGVPQNRKRIFVVGCRGGNVQFPCPNSDRITVSEAISDLPSLPNGASISWLAYRKSAKSPYAKNMRGQLSKSPNHIVTKSADLIIERFRHVPPGCNWTRIPRDLMRNYRMASSLDLHTGLYHRLRADQPSTVIGNYRKNMLIHPEEDRGLSVREAARIQSFPDHYEFLGSIGFQQQQVGNAVPPLLAKAVFDSILSS